MATSLCAAMLPGAARSGCTEDVAVELLEVDGGPRRRARRPGWRRAWRRYRRAHVGDGDVVLEHRRAALVVVGGVDTGSRRAGVGANPRALTMPVHSPSASFSSSGIIAAFSEMYGSMKSPRLAAATGPTLGPPNHTSNDGLSPSASSRAIASPADNRWYWVLMPVSASNASRTTSHHASCGVQRMISSSSRSADADELPATVPETVTTAPAATATRRKREARMLDAPSPHGEATARSPQRLADRPTQAATLTHDRAPTPQRPNAPATTPPPPGDSARRSSRGPHTDHRLEDRPGDGSVATRDQLQRQPPAVRRPRHRGRPPR